MRPMERTQPMPSANERKPYILAVSGFKHSGKTTLIDKLIRRLTLDGFQVASIKHDGHSFTPDVPGTDSEKHWKAGAIGSMVFDGEKYMLIKKQPPLPLKPELFFPEADIILLEGFKNSPYPKIELGQRKDHVIPELSNGSLDQSGICDRDTVLCYLSDVSFPFHKGKPVFSFEASDFDRLYQFVLSVWRKE